MASIHPYLIFNGTCEAAFDFYAAVFGTEATQKTRFKDMPAGDQPMPEGSADRIAHVSLPISEGHMMMGSDTPEGYSPELTMGDNFSISIDTGSEAEAKKLFDALAAGGKVNMPLDKSPWGAYFGMLTDKFSINWMVNFDYNKN